MSKISAHTAEGPLITASSRQSRDRRSLCFAEALEKPYCRTFRECSTFEIGEDQIFVIHEVAIETAV
jgi:hypothetical protein